MNNTTLKIYFTLLCFVFSIMLCANAGENFLNKGNTQYLKGKLDAAFKLYSKAGNSCITEKDKIENNKALVFAQKGKLKLAIERLSTALELNPNNQNAYYNRGLINLQADQYVQAIDDFENAKFLGIASEQELDYNLGLSYYLDNQLDAAKTQLNNVSLTNHPEAVYLNGLIAYQQKEFDQASIIFKKSITLKDHPDVRFAQALASYYAGDTQQGLTSLEKLKKEKSLKEKIQAIHAHLALEANDIASATTSFQAIIKKDKNNPDANAGLGSIALSQADFTKAEHHFRQALKKQPNNEQALEGLARIEFLNGEYEQSIASYDKVLTLNAKNQRALYGKALSAMHRRDPYTCLDALKLIDKSNLTPKQVEKVVLLEANALGICNKKDEAIQLLNKYRSLALDKKKIKTLLAYFNLRMFRYGSAVRNVGLTKYDDYLPYLIAGHASLHRGEHSSAYRYYRKAYNLDSKNPDVLMGAAICMLEIGMQDQALKVIDSLEVLFPDNYYVFNSKGIIYKDLGLQHKKKDKQHQAESCMKTSEEAFNRAKELRPQMASSFDNNIGLTFFYRNDLAKAKALFDGSHRLASKNNRALVDISLGDYDAATRKLDSLNRDYIRKNNLPNNKVKKNLSLANKRAPMANNYKFITYYFLHQDAPALDPNNPFEPAPSFIDLASNLQPELDYILEYSDEECEEEEKKERKKKKKSKPKLKFLKKKKSTKCPTFKT